MGTGKNYSSGTSYGSGYSSYKAPTPSYNRSYSYDSKPKYTPSSGTSVVDRVQKFASMEPRYGQTDYRYPAIDRSTAGKDRYSSLDRYSNRSGYTSDYGGGGTPYSSWDRASTRSNKSFGGSRETSPVSTRSSRYDYSSSASPYSTISSYKSGSDASPVPRPSYDRQSSSRGHDAPDYSGSRSSVDRRSVDRFTTGLAPPASPRQAPRRRESLTDETDDSAPEAEKRETAIRYLVCRGTSPPPDPEAPKRENKAKERISVSRTRRIKVPEKPAEKKSRRQTVIEKRPSHTDCATQVNMDQQAQSRRSRPPSSAGFAGGGVGFTKDKNNVLVK